MYYLNGVLHTVHRLRFCIQLFVRAEQHSAYAKDVPYKDH